MKMTWIICAGVMTPFLVFFFWASYPWELSSKTNEGEIGENISGVTPDTRPSTLSLLTWNISYGYGMGSEGSDGYAPKSKENYQSFLEKIAETIKASDADVVLLQEIDFDSSRSHRVDQLAEIARLSGHRFWARAESWRAQYIPFPFTPISHHFGRMNSGGAILSRWPIVKNEVHLLAKPQSHAWWYNLFYLHRYFQAVTLKLIDREVKLINLHLEAFDQVAKEEQARELVRFVKKHPVDFIAGDFNMLPNGAMKRSGFSNPKDVYEGEQTYTILEKLPLTEVVASVAYLQKEESWFTFPSSRPDRRLDYIYHALSRPLIRAEVVMTPHPEVSDHLPLKAIFKIFEPEFIRD
jgi:endonuclease/exonuclease/phosphatase family metal-dependent hydrolase